MWVWRMAVSSSPPRKITVYTDRRVSGTPTLSQWITRFGATWLAQVEHYSAREHFDDTNSLGSAVWSYDRFGSSLTRLPDGRFIQIAGEHEDFYDPDFYIYNDVVIHDGQGGFKILGYPQEVFPPTDFHTATLVDGSIYVIGCLGYTGRRKIGTTPVFRLTVDSGKIDSVTTSGDIPSWLHEHRATYDAHGT